MRNTWLVIKHEISTTLRKRSFWILTLLMPALFLAFQIYGVIEENDLSVGGEDSEAGTAAEVVLPTIGLVDEAELIRTYPEGIPAGMFVPYADEPAARAALEAGDIDQFVHIPADYMSSGDVLVYDDDFAILRGSDDLGVGAGSANEWMLPYMITQNIAEDGKLATALFNPTPGMLAQQHALRPSEEIAEEGDEALAQAVSQGIPYIYYFILIIISGYILQSVTAEKENRTVEVLLLSLRPRELMAGKVLGLSVVALIQLIIWVGGGMLILKRGSSLFNVSEFTFPPGFILWALLFLVLGYLLYASVMAAAGAIAPSAREGGQVTYLMIVPLMPTLIFGSMFLEQPHHPISVGLSLFPFSAPSAMVTRLAVAEVPLWQIIVSLVALIITVYLVMSLAARFFRPQNLLSAASFSWRRMVTGWRE